MMSCEEEKTTTFRLWIRQTVRRSPSFYTTLLLDGHKTTKKLINTPFIKRYPKTRNETKPNKCKQVPTN